MNFNLTLFGQSIAFFIFVAICMRYVWPHMVAALEERRQGIAQGLADAAKAREELERAEVLLEERRQEAKTQAANILEDANRRAQQIVENAKLQAVEEAQRVQQAAQAEIDHEIDHARETLRGELGSLVIAGVRQVAQKEVDPAAHAQLFKQLANTL